MRVLAANTSATAVMFLTASLGACAPGPSTDSQLLVQESGRVLDHFTVARLEQLPQVRVATPQSHGAQHQTGPSVRSVLDAAGAKDIVRVRVEGRDPAQVITSADLDDPVVLDITKRNTLKLTGAKLGTDRWVRDVTALVVNP